MILKKKKETIDPRNLNLEEKTVYVARVAKVVKGGKRFKFSAWVVIGDRNGHVGLGHGKAIEVPDAVRKAKENARKNIIKIPIINNTIPHEITSKYKASKIIMKPASPGTGIIACDPVRAVFDLGGVKDVLTKSLGSSTTVNLVKAVFLGLQNMKTPEDIKRLRHKDIFEGRRRSGENVES
uniref:Small ribosomal subunit protein uS5 n=1 Tax=candidate division WOR-3 bacterium TaxID=2052148 RepID=A0A7C4U824_UNCW3